MQALPEHYVISWTTFLWHPFGVARNWLLKGRYVMKIWRRYCRHQIGRLFPSAIRRMLHRSQGISDGSFGCNRTVAVAKSQYDALGNREHFLYDSNAVCHMDCSGVLQPLGFRDYCDYRADVIAKRLYPPTGRFLDLGCGNGFNARLLSARFPEARFVGIDISASRLRHARTWMGQCPNVELLQMNAARLAFPDQCFDLVYSCHALEQMESIADEVVAEIVRVMKHRAILIEPVWENASLAQRCYLRYNDYVQRLLAIVERHPGIRLVEQFPLGIQGNPRNQSSVVVFERRRY